MLKKIRYVLIVMLVGILLCACGNKNTVEITIPVTLDNWEDYFELKSRTEVINEERRIKEAEVFYEISLKEEYLNKIVADKESEIKFKYEFKKGDRAITFVEGKNEVVYGDIINLSTPETDDHSIYNAVFEDPELVYETGGWKSFGVSTKDEEASIQTMEEFKMLEIEGDLYLYE